MKLAVSSMGLRKRIKNPMLSTTTTRNKLGSALLLKLPSMESNDLDKSVMNKVGHRVLEKIYI